MNYWWVWEVFITMLSWAFLLSCCHFCICTFQLPTFRMCLGCISGLLDPGAFCWIWLLCIIESLLWGMVTVPPWYSEYSLLLVSFFVGGVISPRSNSQPGGPGDHCLSGCYPLTFWQGLPFHKYKTPSNIALGVIGTCKLPQHNKVLLPIKVGTLTSVTIRMVILHLFHSFRVFPQRKKFLANRKWI